MSNEERTLRFNRMLYDVSPSQGSISPDELSATDDGGDGPYAEELLELRRREEALEREKAGLVRRESELAAKDELLDEELEKLAGLISSIQREEAMMLEANEEAIVGFSLSIAKKVLQHEIENGRYKIGQIVSGALEAVRTNGKVVVRVNPQDHKLAQAAIETLRQDSDGQRISVVPDDDVPPAACCIETDSGRIFSDMAGGLDRIERSLLKKNADSNGI